MNPLIEIGRDVSCFKYPSGITLELMAFTSNKQMRSDFKKFTVFSCLKYFSKLC